MKPEDFEKKRKLKRDVKEISERLKTILDNQDASNLDEESKKELSTLLQKISYDAVPLIPGKDLKILDAELAEQHDCDTGAKTGVNTCKKESFFSFIRNIREPSYLRRLSSILVQVRGMISPRFIPFFKKATRIQHQPLQSSK